MLTGKRENNEYDFVLMSMIPCVRFYDLLYIMTHTICKYGNVSI